MFTITHSQIADAALAYSALCGDITGRGTMLVDNDLNALLFAVDLLVPSELVRSGIPFQKTGDGWTVGPTQFDSDTLVDYLSRLLLHRISPARFTLPDFPTHPSDPLTNPGYRF